jgi:hypothetical protein
VLTKAINQHNLTTTLFCCEAEVKKILFGDAKAAA